MKDLLGEIKIFGLGINLRFKLVHKKWFSLKRPCQKVKYKRKNKFERFLHLILFTLLFLKKNENI